MIAPQSVPGHDDLVFCPVHNRGGPAGWKCGACESDAESRPAAPVASPKKRAKPMGQDAEDALWAALAAAGMQEGAERQFPFAQSIGRKFRADVGYPLERVLVECEGQVHSIKRQRIADMERASIAAVLGYLIVRVDRSTIRDGRAVEWVRGALAARGRA